MVDSFNNKNNTFISLYDNSEDHINYDDITDYVKQDTLLCTLTGQIVDLNCF
jgi:hypothetical protein